MSSLKPVLWFCLLALAASPCLAVYVLDETYGFRTEVPASFLSAATDPRNSALLRRFSDERTNPQPRTCIISLHAGSGELPLDSGNAPVGPDEKVFPMAWKKHTVRRLHAYMGEGQARGVSILVVLPVARRSISIVAVGPASREDEISGFVQFIVARFQAKSNWPEPAADNAAAAPVQAPPMPAQGPALPSPAESSGDAWLWGLLTLVGMACSFGAGWYLRGMSPRTPIQPAPAPGPPPRPASAAAARKPDETDPGIEAPQKCRTCGELLKPGKKRCLNCGAEAF